MILLTLFYAPLYLGLFLIGMWAGQKGILVEVQKHTRLLLRILLICGAVGLIGNLLGAWLLMDGIEESNYGLMLIGNGITSIIGPVLALAYISGLALLMSQRLAPESSQCPGSSRADFASIRPVSAPSGAKM